MAKSDRLLQLMQCLRTLPPPVKAQSLSDELGVSLRTIYRDIDTLRRSGALIDGEAGYGYTLQEDPALPPMMFSRDEMEALVLGLREVVQVADPILAKAAENALSKLKASLPERMMCAQFLKHIDADSTIRFLIAESENPATVMGALYLARQYGVDHQLDISPLFETPEALETGGRFIEQLLQEPEYMIGDQNQRPPQQVRAIWIEPPMPREPLMKQAAARTARDGIRKADQYFSAAL